MSRSQKRRKQRERRSREVKNGVAGPRRAKKPPRVRPQQFSWGEARWQIVVGGAVLAAIFAWAYWPTLVDLVDAWEREPDYSHGFLVAPLALGFLWLRRDRFPGFAGRIAWLGLGLIFASIAVRYVGALYYIDTVDGWSLPLWVAGAVWMLGGWRVLWWAAPSVAYLWFMIPLPYSVERWFRLPLQKIAARISCWTLQVFGQPAFAESNTVFLNETQLEVEEACSGLRIFMAIAALACAYVIVVRRSWWEKLILLASTVPIALAVNAARIVVTGLFYEYVSGEAARKFTHDFAGWMMIPMAAVLFYFVLWYLGKLVYEVQVTDIRAVVRKQGAQA